MPKEDLMPKTVFVNPFVVLRTEKELKRKKGKQALLRHFRQIRSENRRLHSVNIATTIES